MINADETTKLYIDNVFIQFGLPDIIISDRGPQFASKVFNSIFEAIGVKHKMSTSGYSGESWENDKWILRDLGDSKPLLEFIANEDS